MGISKIIGGGPAALSHFGEGKNLKVSNFFQPSPRNQNGTWGGEHTTGNDTWGGENAQLGTVHEEGKYSTEMAHREGNTQL